MLLTNTKRPIRKKEKESNNKVKLLNQNVRFRKRFPFFFPET